ncbi:Methane oxygenase PmoA [Bryocella elongata]|uniref:Methane oxygenase PmoA n=1 Tax=Bryocella elongata TaxID=863522 RepID=A0A1H5ZB39_9BACT|nr:PmoA family protein [Bryocella elongata]SEG33284.1 Methane oxygenase PmoA [Bryocella elongata]
MRKFWVAGALGCALAATNVGAAYAAFPILKKKGEPTEKKEVGVRIVKHDDQRRIDVMMDGQLFTSYRWPTTLMKPVLFPLVSDDGTTVTRGFPLEPRDGERVDHPHHAGMWFNYGNVNGFDFWNNSNAIPETQRPKMGTIRPGRVTRTKNGPTSGEIVADSEWIAGDGGKLFDQTATYVFWEKKGERGIDLTVTLRATEDVTFNDDKEGLLGIRVARWLESPEEKGGMFTDASGRPTQVAAVDNSLATGVYQTSDGVKGPAVWGTRGRWCLLTGHTDGKTETIAIVDHPGNPGYPTYWHARGYGLFAANPLGVSIFDTKQPAFKFSLARGKSATFRYRVVIFSHGASAGELNDEADAFAATK